MIEELESAGWG